jgi:hypothetical protein
LFFVLTVDAFDLRILFSRSFQSIQSLRSKWLVFRCVPKCLS